MAKLGTVYVDVKGNTLPLERQMATSFGPGRMSAFGQRAGSAFASGLEKEGAGVTTLGKRIERTGASIYTTGREITRGIAVPLAFAGGGALKLAIDFEKSMQLVSTQAGVSRHEVANLHDEILSLAREGASSPVELANGLYQVEAAGFHGRRAMEALRAAEDGARVSGSDLATTTFALTAAQRSGIRGTESMGKSMATLSAIVHNGSLTMEDLKGALSTGILPVAKSFGLGIRDVGAALDVLTIRGVPAEEAATRLRLSIALLGGSGGAKARKELQRIGLTDVEVARMMREKGLGPTLGLIKQQLDAFTADPSKQAQLISRMFGGGRSSSAIITLLENLDELKQKQDGIVRSSGRFGADVAAAHQTAAYKIAHAWSNVQVSLIQVGGELAPGVEKAANDVAALAKAFAALPAPIRHTGIDIVGAIAVLGPVGLALGALTRGIGFLISGLGRVGTIGGEAVGFFSRTFTPGMAAAGEEGATAAAAGASTASPRFAAAGAEAGAAWSESYRITVGAGSTSTSTLALGSAEAIAPEMGVAGAEAGAAFGGGLAGAAGVAGIFVIVAAASALASYEIIRHWSSVKRAAGDTAAWTKRHFLGAFHEIEQRSRLDIVSRGFHGIGVAASAVAHQIASDWSRMTGPIESSWRGIGSAIQFVGNQLDSLPSVKIHLPGWLRGISGGGHATGWMVPGTGPGDKVPALLEPGEGVVNREAVRGLGGPRAIHEMNARWPRFASGGYIDDKRGRESRSTGRLNRSAYDPPSEYAHLARGGLADDQAPAGRRQRRAARLYIRDIWQVAKGFYPGPDRQPHLAFPRHLPRAPWGGEYDAYVDGRTDTVNLGGREVRKLNRGADWAENTLIHEWAHVFQPLAKMTEWEREGGAEAFAQAVAPKVYGKLGRPYDATGTNEYPAETARVMSRHDAGWIMRGQFADFRGGRGGGGARIAGGPRAPAGPTGPYGTKENPAKGKAPAGPQGPAGGGRNLGSFLSTSYGPPWNSMQGHGTTSGGTNLTKGPHLLIVASDPRVIPLGTTITAHPNPFQTDKRFLVDDTGGAIKGRHIDFYDWRGRAFQNKWNRQTTVRAFAKAGRPLPLDLPKDKKKKAGQTPTPKEVQYGYAYPLARRGKLIGTPGQGTHSFSAPPNNWQSDNAVDIAARFGTEVLAVTSGKIVKTGGSGNFGGRFGGYNLTIASPNNEFFYAHLSKVTAKQGQSVEKGQGIGRSGKANGVEHLHFAEEHGSPLGIARGHVTEPTSQVIHVPGAGNITITGSTDIGGVRDAVTQRYESRYARAKLTPRLGDDLHWATALLRLWEARLKYGTRTHDDALITQAADSVTQYREEVKGVRQKIRERRGKPVEMFKLGTLDHIGRDVLVPPGKRFPGSGPPPTKDSTWDQAHHRWSRAPIFSERRVNIGGIQATLDQVNFEIAKAGLSGPGEPGGGVTGFDDDVAAAKRLVDLWTGVWQLADRQGTLTQKTEAATKFGDAKTALKSAQDEQSPDAAAGGTERDSERAAILEQELLESRKQLGLFRAASPILQRFAGAQVFHEGGTVQGPLGAEVPVMARGGEVLGYAGKPEEHRQEVKVSVFIEDGAVQGNDIDPSKVRVLVNDEVSEMARKARSGGPVPGRRYTRR